MKPLSKALNAVLPEDDSHGDPQFLSRSALAMSLSSNWHDDARLEAAVECARRFWSGQATEAERSSMRETVVDHAENLRKQGLHGSREWSRYALAMSALDILTPSNGFAADYLVEFALAAGIPIEVIREALEANVPGLTAALAMQEGR